MAGGGRPRLVGCDVALSSNYPAHSSCHSSSVGCHSSYFFKYCEMEQEHEPDSCVNQSLINTSAAVHTLVTHAPAGQLSPKIICIYCERKKKKAIEILNSVLRYCRCMKLENTNKMRIADVIMFYVQK